MARRRKRSSRLVPALLVLAAAAGGAWWFAPPGWRTAIGLEPRAPRPPSLCDRLPEEKVAALVGRVAVEARVVAVPAGVPAAGACRWEFFGGGIDGRWFDVASLSRATPPMTPADYYASVLTGLEYEFKQAPQPIEAGEQAALAGYDGGDLPQAVVRTADRVIVLELRGVDRGHAATLLRAFAAGS
jgi:hypothetical protein